MNIPTEPIGSIPRSPELIAAITSNKGNTTLTGLYEQANHDTITYFEESGSPVISDGEQSKSSFATYPLEGLGNLSAEGMKIEFADGHFRQLPLLKEGPFRYGKYAVEYLKFAQSLQQFPLSRLLFPLRRLASFIRKTG